MKIDRQTGKKKGDSVTVYGRPGRRRAKKEVANSVGKRFVSIGTKRKPGKPAGHPGGGKQVVAYVRAYTHIEFEV